MKTIQSTLTAHHPTASIPVPGLLHRFLTWCEGQEKNRLGWVAAIITGHGCFITPLTLLFVMLAGNNFIYWPMVIGAMGMSLVSNLAALPTKVTLPIFFFSLLIDIVVIGSSLSSLF